MSFGEGNLHERVEALESLANDMREMFRIGHRSGEGLDKEWCRELDAKYSEEMRRICAGKGE
jgi:hypothetical protein